MAASASSGRISDVGPRKIPTTPKSAKVSCEHTYHFYLTCFILIHRWKPFPNHFQSPNFALEQMLI